MFIKFLKNLYKRKLKPKKIDKKAGKRIAKIANDFVESYTKKGL